jgi:hypothetical protein
VPDAQSQELMKSCYNLSVQLFENYMVPDCILGATKINGEIIFLMRWKNSTDHDLVMARVANKKCPDVVIRYYEKNLRILPEI